ncbi:hypothetical protein KYK30_04175 [Shinella yambaruensis]|uniref:Uncharacterized protein n=1 Tax=Shinella yambaruensis TaxID=415996 RepID=A0ABQ5ZGN7_9HYPH|nr:MULTISPECIES: hypothetical protein [Shinella]CAI0337703.1 conserved hypothetical protein [Rhizobiaceae bacterium]CAK7256179.1 conserved protein of unknown function [Shinella sp. WSC3-e]MCJ8023978.1 hypothetical protein [Shinella yambaruensis]MCO5140328.1 hypothetical protein [Shinella sp.]MCU7978872.1 hypothetical protein [Shinella yambaruensis]
MDVLRDPAHIGIFEPQDLVVLQRVFTRLAATNTPGLDEARARSLARSIITLYRHGVRDPEQLFDVLQVPAS